MNHNITSKNLVVQDENGCRHHPVKAPGREATCTVPGLTEGVYCPLCGETINRIFVIPPMGHRPSEWCVEKAPAPDAFGLKVKKCLVCGERLDEEVLPPIPGDLKISEGLSYRINYNEETCESTCEITGQGTCKDKNIVIPNVIDGYVVTGIVSEGNSSGFDKEIGSVVIPSFVTSIGANAFDGCANLTSVTIPDSVTVIEAAAFSGCASLASVAIPNSVTAIGNFTFFGCTSLASMTIPDSVTSIGNWAFRDCVNLASVTISDSVKSIGTAAFSGCASLASVTIPDSVTSIGSSAFQGCASLTSIKIPDSVTGIGSDVFRDCASLANVEIPNSVGSIGNNAFNGCAKLVSIVVPDSVIRIGDYAFKDCASLTDLVISDSVLMDMNETVWEGCKSLPSIPRPKMTYKMNYEDDSYTMIKCHCREKHIQIPARVNGLPVTGIANAAFKDCTELVSVTIPDSVTKIGEYAFSDCTSLVSVAIPKAIVSIDNSAFRNCENLSNFRYTGTMEQWKMLKSNKLLKKETSLRTVECSDGKVYIRY